MPKGGKLDRCVEHVKAKGKGNPYAICHASLGKGGKTRRSKKG